jgi:ferritin-like metal-binding protein YciE
MARQPKQLDELFHEGLKDIYFAEKKILVALPKMAKAAQLDRPLSRSITRRLRSRSSA